MAEQITIVDAFTDQPFHGNPAAVCVLESERTDRWMAAVAREMNLSETAFIRQQEDGWSLRWFTPAVEVDLCGHATLAAAHVLLGGWVQWRGADTEPLTACFHTRSGVLTARREGAALVLDFPSEPAVPAAAPEPLLPALGITSAEQVARNRFDYLVVVSSPEQVRALRPDMRALRDVETRGVIVTAPSDDPSHDFVSRWFGPRVGVDEDPVTGSAHCCLGPWWAAVLGRQELTGYQASSRGGVVGVRMRGDRVELVGSAVTVLRGTLADQGDSQRWGE